MLIYIAKRSHLEYFRSKICPAQPFGKTKKEAQIPGEANCLDDNAQFLVERHDICSHEQENELRNVFARNF